MTVRYRRYSVLLCFLIAISGFLNGCAAVVRPNYQTELAKLRPGDYELDPAHSFLVFKIDHLGLSTYVGRFNDIHATLDFDPASISQLRLDSVVSMASVDVNDADLEERLASPDWFDVPQFPEARFVTVKVEEGLDGNFLFTGDLTFRGVTRPVVLSATFNGGADNLLTGRYTLGFSATGSFNRSDFGMDQWESLVGDEVSLEVYAEFLRK